jgi:hypothetical protein
MAAPLSARPAISQSSADGKGLRLSAEPAYGGRDAAGLYLPTLNYNAVDMTKRHWPQIGLSESRTGNHRSNTAWS